MKLASFNIGIKIDNAQAVGEFIHDLDADIICLQEVVRPLDESVFSMYRSKEVIDKILLEKYPYSFFGPQWVAREVELSGNRLRDYGGSVEQGNYTLSKFPIVSADNIHYLYNYRLEIDHKNFEKTDHPRSAVLTTINFKGKEFLIVNIHGCYSKEKIDTPRSLAQSEFLVKLLKDEQRPVLLVGDFNVSPDTKSVNILKKHFKEMMEANKITSLKGYGDNLEITKLVDYFFINDKVLPDKLEIIKSDISDHPPIVFSFNL